MSGPLNSTGDLEVKSEEKKEQKSSGISVAMLGNVNAGKSTTMGVLLSSLPDDGRGLQAGQVCKHPHERISKKTSDVSLKDGTIDGRNVSMCDLAGHSMYFKTTISGIMTNYPDLVLLCVDRNIEKTTREHLGLATRMNIPVLILITKVDFREKEQIDETYQNIKKLVNGALHRKIYDIRSMGDVDVVLQSSGTVGVIKISNTTLVGHDRLRKYLQKYVASYYRNKVYPEKVFTVTAIYHVRGVGLVLAGQNGDREIKTGESLYMLLSDGSSIKVDVKSIHDDFRHQIGVLPPKERGCLAIRNSGDERMRPYRGCVLAHVPSIPSDTFTADVNMLSSARVTINKGFVAILNMNSLREAVQVIQVHDHEKLKTTRELVFKFVRGPRYIEPGQHFFFREGSIVGEGIISKGHRVEE
jgi:elongation factor 1-alpha